MDVDLQIPLLPLRSALHAAETPSSDLGEHVSARPEPRAQAPPLPLLRPAPGLSAQARFWGSRSAAGHPRFAAMEIPGSLCKKVKLSNNAQNWVSGGRGREREERGRLWEPVHPVGAGGGDPGGGGPRRLARARLARPRAAAETE